MPDKQTTPSKPMAPKGGKPPPGKDAKPMGKPPGKDMPGKK
jgi:hypothetical protein